jgi:antitoxin YefM
MNAIKCRAVVKNGKLDMPVINLPEGTVVEAVLWVDQGVQDETGYLLSTDANRRYLLEALEELKQPQDFVYVDIDKL